MTHSSIQHDRGHDPTCSSGRAAQKEVREGSRVALMRRKIDLAVL